MGHIKEPPGVDFIIQSKPLTNDDRTAISEYIRHYKAKHKNKQGNSRAIVKTKSQKAPAQTNEQLDI